LISFDGTAVFHLMRRHWLPRCSPPLTEDELDDGIADARRAFEAQLDAESAKEKDRERAEWRAERQVIRSQRAAAEAVAKQRTDNAESVKKVMAALTVGERQAQRLLKYGSTMPDQAKRIAEALGTAAVEHLRPKARSGRNPNIVGMLLRPFVAGASWQDFIDDPPELEGPKLELRNAFAGAYKGRAGVPDHVRELEPVSDFAQSVGIDSDVAVDLWNIYKPWRIERVMAAALDEVADPFDFG
jgi:hypothetical protein